MLHPSVVVGIYPLAKRLPGPCGEGELEILLRLPRKTHEDVRSEGYPGHRGADPLDQVQIVLPGVAAVHGPEDPVGAVLHRQVKVFADRRRSAHHLDQLLGEILGM